MTEGLRLSCQSCGNPKQHLERINSKITGWPLNLCQECIKSKFEPRWLIILAIRHFGRNDLVDGYIRKRLYVGIDIPAADIL